MLAQELKENVPSENLEQVNAVIGIITAHLRYVERARIAQTPWSMVQSVERLLKLTVGQNSRFIVRPTWTYNYSIIGEFVSAYISLLANWSWFPLAEWKNRFELNQCEKSIYCISFPRIERMNCLLHANWGHEVGHILAAKWVRTEFEAAWNADVQQIKKRIEDHIEQNLPPVDPLFKKMVIQEAVARQLRSIMDTARQGFVELLCDQIGVHILGPSALAAAMEFAARYSLDVSPLQASNYPPWRYRLRNMLNFCKTDLDDHDDIEYPNAELLAFIQWLRSGRRLVAATGDQEAISSNVITKEAYDFIEKHWNNASDIVKGMLPAELERPYRVCEHYKEITILIGRLQEGVPPNEAAHLSTHASSFQDILSAAWAFKMDQISNNQNWGTPKDHDLLFRLVLKGCESSYVHSKWGSKFKK